MESLPRGLNPRGDEPALALEPGTPEACTFWRDHDGEAACEAIVVAFDITLDG